MDQKEIIKVELMEMLNEYYNGSFLQMACEYIRSTGMTQEKVKELLETTKQMANKKKQSL